MATRAAAVISDAWEIGERDGELDLEISDALLVVDLEGDVIVTSQVDTTVALRLSREEWEKAAKIVKDEYYEVDRAEEQRQRELAKRKAETNDGD